LVFYVLNGHFSDFYENGYGKVHGQCLQVGELWKIL